LQGDITVQAIAAQALTESAEATAIKFTTNAYSSIAMPTATAPTSPIIKDHL